MKNFKKYLIENKINDIKKDLKKLIKGDEEIKKQKTIQDKLDYIYYAYKKEIEQIIKYDKIDYDEIVKILKQII